MRRFFVSAPAWGCYLGLVFLYSFSFWQLILHRRDETFWSWADAFTILKYSILQAGLSALLSTIFGLCVGRAFFYLNFKGKYFLLKTFSFIWTLPSLIVIFAVIGVWGNSGWLAQIFSFLGLEWQFSLYGLVGILLAHCFFNIPYGMLYSYALLKLIPNSQHKLAAQLNITGWQRFKLVEWPILKKRIPFGFMTIFLICFTSFPIVLMLGGGPKYSTFEVAIFQAVNFEFDFAKAVMLIAVQVVVAVVLKILLNMVTPKQEKIVLTPDVESWIPQLSNLEKRGLQIILCTFGFALLVPLCSVIWEGISVSHLMERLQNPMLWQATAYSLMLGFIAAIVAVCVAYSVALAARHFYYQKQFIRHAFLASTVVYPLIFPIFLLSVGLYFFFQNSELSTFQLLLLVGVCNGIVTLPYIYSMIFDALWQTLTRQDKLAKSLGLSGFRRWWIVEKNYLIRSLLNAFALAMSSSLGSFAVIAFFGSPDFSSLPYLLYQQLGSYRMEDAAVTAAVLMAISALPFWVLMKNKKGYI